MELPFTAEQFHGVFRDYSTTLWPVQVLLLGLAGSAVVLVMRACVDLSGQIDNRIFTCIRA